MRVVSFKIEDDLLAMLEEYARKRNMPKSEIIRRALKQYMSKQEDKPFITRRMKIYT